MAASLARRAMASRVSPVYTSTPFSTPNPLLTRAAWRQASFSPLYSLGQLVKHGTITAASSYSGGGFTSNFHWHEKSS